MGLANREELLRIVGPVRQQLEEGFRPDTAAGGFPVTTPSAGHCAAVSAILGGLLGAGMVSALVDGRSHWFNRIQLASESVDLDLTGDQFGFPPLQVSDAGRLYPGARVRQVADLNAETLRRATLLAERSRLTGAIEDLMRDAGEHVKR
jgi:hypothetical protein